MLYASEQEGGTYQNPVLYADYSDPDAIRVGDDYYMIASSFTNVPGIPVLHSRDLVNWRVINYVLDRLPEYRYINPQHGSGVWAPAIRYYEGEYFVFFPMPDEGIYMCRTSNPYGTWSRPLMVMHEAGVIDPCPFWDDDGRLYLVTGVSGARKGYNSVLRLTELDPESFRPVSDTKIIYDGRNTIYETIEGPKVHKKDGYYYIFAPAGGVKGGFQAVLRAERIEGPYEIRVVMRQGKGRTNGPHQGAWVDTVKGQDWFLHFQDVYACGRIVHLQPMRWRDGWPVIGRAVEGETWGEPVDVYTKPEAGVRPYGPCEPEHSDEFEKETLSFMWQWNANPSESWYSLEPQNSRIRLNAVRTNALRPLCDIRNLLLTKWAAPEFCAAMAMDLSGLKAGDVAGLVSLGMTFGGLGVRRTSEGDYEIVRILGNQEFDQQAAYAQSREETIPLSAESLQKAGYQVIFDYRVEVTDRVDVLERHDCYGNEVWVKDSPRETVSMSLSIKRGEEAVPVRDAAFSFPARAGRWVGVKYGPFCYHKPLENKRCDDPSAPPVMEKDEAGFVRVDYLRAKRIDA